MPEGDWAVNLIDFHSIYLNAEFSKNLESDFFCHSRMKILRGF
jgi:hypothetical protein